MQSRSVARELALLMLGQVSDRQPSADTSLDTLLQQALASLSQHVREALDQAATELQAAQQQLAQKSIPGVVQEGAKAMMNRNTNTPNE